MPTLFELIEQQKAAPPVVEEQSSRDAIHGTGITKKIVTKTQKEIEKVDAELEVVTEDVSQEIETVVNDKVISLDTTLGLNITLDDSQQFALDGLLNNSCACLIGAAGTGKTTVERFFVERLVERYMRENKDLSIAFCAFTGRAVQQMKRALPPEFHKNSSTIHRMLGYRPIVEEYFDDESKEYKERKRFRPAYDKTNKLPYNVIIMDEGGMTSVLLWNEVMDAIKDGTKLYIIGDINQLPPVQGRSVLGFAMLKWPTFALEKIHRQAADNSIIKNAHRILEGKWPEHDNDFYMKSIDDGSIGAYNDIVNSIKYLTKKGAFEPFRDAAIVPQNVGMLGQEYINENLLTFFNPEIKSEEGGIVNKRHVITAGRTQYAYAVGDKVMLLQNDNERQLTNGMVGRVCDIKINGNYHGNQSSNSDSDFSGSLHDLADHYEDTGIDADEDDENKRQASHVVAVRFYSGQDEIETYFQTAGQFQLIKHAYVFTCHKSQGGEYENVIVAMHSANRIMLTREWLYTAVTRAQKRVFLLYNDRGLKQALNTQRIKGNTIKEKAESFLAIQDQNDTSLPELPDNTELE